MMKPNRVIGIIPARGGSKRLKRKNILDLGGKPLFKWVLDTAIESGVFTDLFVSTEDEEIGQLAGKYWWKRPPDLAGDKTPTLPVVIDVFEGLHGTSEDIVATMQPTFPFLTDGDIKASMELLLRSNADSVTSVIEGPSDLAFKLRWANRLELIPDILVENGAIYWITGKALREGHGWYSGYVYGYRMPKDRSLDIDTEQDLEIARHLVRTGLNGNGHVSQDK